MEEFSINGRMAVKTLKKQFLEKFGAGLRVYDSKKFADNNATLASIRTGDTKGGDFECAGNMQVGNFETEIKELYGIIVQVVDKEDKRLIDNAITLSKAADVAVTSRKTKGDNLMAISNAPLDVIQPNDDKITTTINFYLPYKDYHLVSQDYIINKSVLEKWTLGRLKVPDFENEEQIKKWILEVDAVVKFYTKTALGSSFPYRPGSYLASRTEEATKEDVNGNSYTIPDLDIESPFMQEIKDNDFLELYDLLKDEKPTYLNQSEYSTYSSVKEENGKFYFSALCMDYIVGYLLNTEKAKYSPPKEQLVLSQDFDTNNYLYDDDFDETNAFWHFKDLTPPLFVLVIGIKFKKSKIEDTLSFWDSEYYWDEKFVVNDTLYLAIYQTEATCNKVFSEQFLRFIGDAKECADIAGKLTKYGVHTVKDYVEAKMILREEKTGVRRKSNKE